MSLQEYLSVNHLTLAALARRSGYTQASLEAVMQGRRHPGWHMMETLRRATNGAVLPQDFFSNAVEARA